jgi:hypothetical protein
MVCSAKFDALEAAYTDALSRALADIDAMEAELDSRVQPMMD